MNCKDSKDGTYPFESNLIWNENGKTVQQEFRIRLHFPLEKLHWEIVAAKTPRKNPISHESM